MGEKTTITDKDGTWEIEQQENCIVRQLKTPSAEWLAKREIHSTERPESDMEKLIRKAKEKGEI